MSQRIKASVRDQASARGVVEPDFQPLFLPGLVLWLAGDKITGVSDGANFSPWSDSSGQGNDAAEASNPPTYQEGIQNGLPIVRFDGVDRLTVSGFGTTEFSVITQMTTYVLYNPRGDNGYNVLDLGTIGQHWRFADGGFYNSYFRTGRSVNDPPNQPNDSNWHYHTLRSGPASAYDIFRDGVGGDEYAQLWGVASDNLIIANGGDAGGLAGDIAEIAIYNVEHTNAQVDQFEAYLVDKWGL